MPRPTSTHEQRESVRLLALAIGVREAARKLGLDENRVMKWSERFKWLSRPSQPSQLTPVKGEGQQTVSKTADTLANVLLEQGRATKHGLSGAALKAATRFSEMPADEIIDRADKLGVVTKVASTIHGWQDSQATSALNLNVLSGGRAIVQVNETKGSQSPNDNSE